jgi:hypothetical protein
LESVARYNLFVFPLTDSATVINSIKQATMVVGSNNEEPHLMDDISGDVSDAKRSRSVNDFDAEYALRQPLRDGRRRIPDQMQLEGVAERTVWR